jgi:signal transduction histidine kinase
MSEHPGSARSDDTWADWARWTALAVFAALIGVGLLPLNPSPLAASVGAVVAIGAAVVLVWHLEGRYLLVVVAIAVAGVAVLGNGESTNVAWFSVCILGFWCALHGRRWEYLAYLAGGLILFAVEWLWIHVDAGWGAWMGGITLSVAAGALVRHERQLTEQLRAAQAGLAERARAEERNRIARELHDVIAHTLTVSLLHVSSARLAVENGLDDANRALAEAERLGRESLDEVRRVVGLLHADGSATRTVPLPGGGDLPALVERFRSAGAAATFTVEGDIAALPATTGLAVYRVLQEALTNAIKHAPGASTEVRVEVAAEDVRLEVDTSGAPGNGTGLGLISMRERAESVGGACSAEPGGRGWLVTATFPLDLDRSRRREPAS